MLSEKFIRVFLNYGFCGLPSKHYSIFDFVSLSSSLSAILSLWWYIFVNFERRKNSTMISKIASKLIEHLSRNISNYSLVVLACSHLPAAHSNLHVKASHRARVRTENDFWAENRQPFSFSHLSCVKLNGNYFPLTLQHWQRRRKKLVMVS